MVPDASYGVDEIRPLIAQLINLLLRLPLNPVVPFSSEALAVLTPEEQMLNNASSQ